MNNALVRSSKAIKGVTSAVRSHMDAVERATELYLATIRRAEADYFDRIKRATEMIAGEEAETPAPPVTESETNEHATLP